MKSTGHSGLERIYIEIPDENGLAVAGFLLCQINLPRQFRAFKRLAFRRPMEFAGKVHGRK